MARRGRVMRPHGREGGRARRTWGMRAGAALLLCLALAAALLWLVYRGSQAGDAGAFPPTATPPATRTPLATPIPGLGTVAIPSTPLPTEVPLPLDRAETLRLPATTGAALALRDYRGRPVVLFFYYAVT